MFTQAQTLLSVIVGLGVAPSPQADLSTTAPAPKIISHGKLIDLKMIRTPELPNVYIFYKPSSTMEKNFVTELRKDSGKKVAFVLIELSTGKEPVAAKYSIIETPTVLVYDRRGRLVSPR